MNKKIMVVAIAQNGSTITSGWFDDVAAGTEYVGTMIAKGYLCVCQYKEV